MLYISSEVKSLTLLHSEWPKLNRVLAILNAIGLMFMSSFGFSQPTETILKLLASLEIKTDMEQIRISDLPMEEMALLQVDSNNPAVILSKNLWSINFIVFIYIKY